MATLVLDPHTLRAENQLERITDLTHSTTMVGTEMASSILYEPFEKDTILEVRRGKMKPMPGLKIESGIDKSLCEGPVWVNKMGLAQDEHDLTFHGGIDKAVHGCMFPPYMFVFF